MCQTCVWLSVPGKRGDNPRIRIRGFAKTNLGRVVQIPGRFEEPHRLALEQHLDMSVSRGKWIGTMRGMKSAAGNTMVVLWAGAQEKVCRGRTRSEYRSSARERPAAASEEGDGQGCRLQSVYRERWQASNGGPWPRVRRAARRESGAAGTEQMKGVESGSRSGSQSRRLVRGEAVDGGASGLRSAGGFHRPGQA